MAKTPKSPKLEIANEMREFDLKRREFYDELNDEEQKAFSPYLMLRWGASVTGNSDFQKFYLRNCNEQANKHFFTLSKHKKLQWLMLCNVSPNMGIQRHEWIAFGGKGASDKRLKILSDIYPDQKIDDLETLLKVMTDTEFKTMMLDHGYTDKQIKEALK